MLNDHQGKAVLITGGTKGIGLAVGLAFGRLGAQVYLTHRWGSADEGDITEQFADAGAAEPVIMEADVSQKDDTKALMERIAADGHDGIELFLSNVCIVPLGDGVEGFSRRAVNRSLSYSAWPLVAYVQQSKKIFGRYPRYVIGTSSDGPDHYYQGYEYVAFSKSVMESFCRYLARPLYDAGSRINMVRTRNVITESALEVHGESYPDFVRKYGGEQHFIDREEVAGAIVALCSGLLDAMNGQVINVDRGGPFADNLMALYRRREELGL